MPRVRTRAPARKVCAIDQICQQLPRANCVSLVIAGTLVFPGEDCRDRCQPAFAPTPRRPRPEAPRRVINTVVTCGRQIAERTRHRSAPFRRRHVPHLTDRRRPVLRVRCLPQPVGRSNRDFRAAVGHLARAPHVDLCHVAPRVACVKRPGRSRDRRLTRPNVQQVWRRAGARRGRWRSAGPEVCSGAVGVVRTARLANVFISRNDLRQS
jgi:hypothetical protein